MNLVNYRPTVLRPNLFDDFGHLLDYFDRGSTTPAEAERFSPAVNVAEDETQFLIEAELPGVKAEDVNVTVEDRVLTLEGQKRSETTEDKGNWHRVERHYGSFKRSFRLPDNVNAEGARSEFKDGLLKVTLPKSEEARRKSIPIATT